MGFDTFSRDPGAWASAAVVIGVLLAMLSDLILAADRLTVSGAGSVTSGRGFRAHFLVITNFATYEVAIGLLLAVGIAHAVRTSTPATFRGPALYGAAVLALVVAVVAIPRALLTLSYWHAFGFGGFFADLTAIPVALVAAGLGFVAARRPSP
jgi:hypothetical protein